MIEGLTSRQWQRFNGWVLHLIDHPKLKRCCTQELAELALVAVLKSKRKPEPEVSDELLASAVELVRYRRVCRRERLHRERAARLRRRVVTG